MTTVSILGTGNMGPAIASVVEKGGNIGRPRPRQPDVVEPALLAA